MKKRWSDSFQVGVYILTAVLFLVVLGIAYHQYRFLCSDESGRLREQASAELLADYTEKGVRGNILDRNRNILATSVLRHNVQAHLVPNLRVYDLKATAHALSDIIGLSEKEIYTKLALSDSYKENYATIDSNVSAKNQRKLEVALFDKGKNISDKDPLYGVKLTYDKLPRFKYSLQAFLKPLDEVNDPGKVARVLGPILKKSVYDLKSTLTSDNDFVYLLPEATEDICSQAEVAIKTHNLRGVRIIKDEDGNKNIQAILRPFKSVADPQKASEILSEAFKVPQEELFEKLNSETKDTFYFECEGCDAVYENLLKKHKGGGDGSVYYNSLDPLEGIDICKDPVKKCVVIAYLEKRPSVKNIHRTAEILAPILGKSKEYLLEQLDSEGGTIPFSYLSKDVSDEVVNLLQARFDERDKKKADIENNVKDRETRSKLLQDLEREYDYLEGIEISSEKNDVRSHPQGRLASHVLGYIGFSREAPDGFVKTGAELSLDERLTPKGVLASRLVDSKQRPIYEMFGVDDGSVKKGKMGYDAILTIDMRIQKIVEKELAAKVETYRKAQKRRAVVDGSKRNYKPCEGTCIVLDAKTAEVLAMANYPDFDPNEYYKSPPENLVNKAIGSRYEPGSVFKTFLAGTALHNGISSDTYFVCGGIYNAAGIPLRNSHGGAPGSATLKQIISDSWNTGSVSCAVSMGQDKYKAGIKSFGFYDITGIELPGEIYGDIGDNNGKERWNYVDFCVRAYGQALAVTPMQIASALQSVANDGVRMRPHIVRGFVDRSDGSASFYESKVLGQPLKASEAKELRDILADVITNGTGYKAMVKGYKTGGKTGTANTYEDNGQLAENYYTASFIGIAPIDKPSVVVLVKIGNVDSSLGIGYGGGDVAAPVFSDICTKVLPLRGVKPTPGYVQAKPLW
ncbi:hypothetical protein IJT10_04940 [bacterium]|nr:hypothetical protein [bacterium]